MRLVAIAQYLVGGLTLVGAAVVLPGKTTSGAAPTSYSGS